MNLLFSFAGRIGRGKFWLGQLVLIGLSIVASILIGMFVPMDQLYAVGANGQPVLDEMGMPTIDWASPAVMPVAIAWGAMILALVWMSLAIGVKRCHDRGKSGWWMLISLIPIAGFIWWLVDLGIIEGLKGDNKYGPDPQAV